MDGNGVEIVPGIEVREFFADVGEHVVVHLEGRFIEDGVFFIDDAVVDAVEPTRFADEIFPRRAFVAEVSDAVLRLDVFVFEETQEDETIQGALGDFGQRLAVEFGITILEGVGEFVPVLIQLLQEGFVHRQVAAFEQAALDGFAAFLGERFNKFLK